MKKIGFDAEKYIEEQSKYILERINENESERLYLEFGGKLVQDKHAKRVLPGFDENAKIKLLHRLKDKAEIVICIYSGDIVTNKTRQDFGITYDMEVLRIIDMFRRYELSINSVVVTRYEDEPAVNMFISRLERRGIRTYKHSFTKGYPTDVDTIVSEEGYGANPYIEVSKPIVVVNAPGGGSGKLATCLSQLYHEKQRGVTARYAKFETFPIWSLPLKHPVNIAYEAATADLKDVNMIDSFHLEAYGETAVNYNRDLEIFPVLKRIIEKITGKEAEYKSPTDMGVNRAGFCITDDEVCREAACQEVIRRYLIAECDYKKGKITAEPVSRCKLLMDELDITPDDRVVVRMAHEYVDEHLMVAPAAAILNAVKVICGFADELHLISPHILEDIKRLKTTVLKQEGSALNVEEILTALTISGATNPMAELAVEKLTELDGCKAHSTAILTEKDEMSLKSIGIDITCDPEYETTNLYYG